MRISILTAGSAGDVRPFTALGAALSANGHGVTVAAFDGFEHAIRERGLEFFPVNNPLAALEQTDEWQRWKSSGGNWLRLASSTRALVRRARDELVLSFQAYLEASIGADLVVGTFPSLVGPLIARRANAAFSWSSLQPLTETREFPHFLLAGASLGSAVNRFSHRVGARVWRALFGAAFETFWRGPLAASDWAELVPSARHSRVLYGFSRALQPPPRDWTGHHCISGFWFPEHPTALQPSDALRAFVERGPCVYVGLADIRPRVHGSLLDALAGMGARCVIRAHRECPSAPPESIVVPHAPHAWLFPRVRAVVHHGGIGTIAEALRAGVPSLVLSGFFDQPFWGERLARSGAGRRLDAEARLTPRLIRPTLEGVLSPATRDAAVTISRRIESEDGVGAAVDWIERTFSRPAPAKRTVANG